MASTGKQHSKSKTSAAVLADVKDSNINNTADQSSVSRYGGTRFCLVSMPSPSQSPKMPRQNKRHYNIDGDAEDVSPSLSGLDESDGTKDVIEDRRLSNPAFDAGNVGDDDGGDHEGPSNGRKQSSSSRLDNLLLTLRKDLKSLQHQDQALLRQFLNIYQTISDLHCDAPLAPYTPPSPPAAIQFQGSAALSPAIMADEVRDLVSYQGQLNIKDVVSRLSPIRRRRTSEPFSSMDEDSFLDLSVTFEHDTDPLSLSSPFL